ncbi:large subunit ribosomal protein L4 [Bacilli bacterium PM5-3]|nr:large subunit ribosomal protein L4 [Bacilli bacterium PM5-3]MDH6604185.1 large subunit ribosomal protein L4 [Bacilli bacterium PM5-9]
MAKVDLFNQAGSSVGKIELSDAVFGIEPNKQAMFDAVLTYRASLRQGTHSTKNRSEVRGGGRKPWRQKGTGRARQGSIRSPQWRGGGVVFGPTPEKNYKLKMNRKVRKLAMRSAYSVVAKDKQLIALESLAFDAAKTKTFIEFMNAFNVDKKLLVVVAPDSDSENVFLSGRNLPKVKVAESNNITVEDLLHYDVVMMTQDAIKMVEEVLV